MGPVTNGSLPLQVRYKPTIYPGEISAPTRIFWISLSTAAALLLPVLTRPRVCQLLSPPGAIIWYPFLAEEGTTRMLWVILENASATNKPRPNPFLPGLTIAGVFFEHPEHIIHSLNNYFIEHLLCARHRFEVLFLKLSFVFSSLFKRLFSYVQRYVCIYLW